MVNSERQKNLKLIKQNIEKHGFHIYVVVGGMVPRFAYTIGLSESIEAELVVAGSIYFTGDEVTRIINTICKQLKIGKDLEAEFNVDDLCSFTLRQVHESWSNSLLLGALDYYKTSNINAYQIIPAKTHWTIDIPNLDNEWNVASEPMWQWLHEKWPYNISPMSTATTNLDALRGARITEVTRWEEDEWEIFAGPGPDVSYEEARVVPLGNLLTYDPSLNPILDLKIGKGIWREDSEGSDWHHWKVTQAD